MSTTPAGWYPDPLNAGQQRYWNGVNWTEHSAPAPGQQAAAAPSPAPHASAAQTTGGAYPTEQLAPGVPSTATLAAGATGGGFGAWWSSRSTAAKVWMIVGAIAVVLLLISGIGRAIAVASNTSSPRDVAPVDVQTASPEAEPSLEPTEPPVATTTPQPAPAVADPVVFMAQANGHLDDMLKDLDDMIVTLDEGGFWRLLSNSVELSFNTAQLEALDVPANIAQSYSEEIAAMDVKIEQMSTPIGNSDDPGLRALIEQLRAQIEAARSTVNQAA